jgi:hypothetical protein
VHRATNRSLLCDHVHLNLPPMLCRHGGL